MSDRFGSADSVVFPVPDSPKNRAASSRGPTFAEQCMVRMPRRGSRKFMIEKMLFLTSPAYSVPSTSTRPRSKSMPMKVSERTPLLAPPAASEPAWMTVNAGR
jgi:hypothetical protein